ncbi:MAG: PPC domain-containing protein [Planctomycetota bacterium]|jgi:hypothetical protein
MMMVLRLALGLALIAGLAGAQGAPNQKRPYIGYLCAAGGQRGTVVRIIAGGQSLRGAREVIVSGEGVTGEVIRFRRPPWLLSPDERRAVAQHLRRIANRKKNGGARPDQQKKRRAAKKNKTKKSGAAKKELLPLPDHPMLKDLQSLTPKELRRLAYEFLDPRRRSQLSAQIAETVELEITIDRRAEPGDRELRIRTSRGLTNPVLFQVGMLPEFKESEPNDYRTSRQPTVAAPCVLNGQVSFRDLDRFRFRARQGQMLVIEAQARRLVPYLADAVPGWFQATLALYDAAGNELRFVDDHRFDPDPVLLFDVPEDGDYVLEIRDAIHRGREDFVYRVTVAERPFVLAMFPLGAKAGSSTTAKIEGWNVEGEKVRLRTRRGSDEIREVIWSRANLRANPVLYAVDDLPERIEAEPNDEANEAQWLPIPTIVNGRIARPGEVDWYRFRGRVGQEIVIEVNARRLGSPLDSLIQLTDAAGHNVAWNDDHPDKSAGLVTHQADSYLRAKLLATESYYIRVTDAQRQGGASFAYRLRVSKPRPDFAVIVTPASVNVPAGGCAPITVHVVRRDGFDGEIGLSLPDAPRGLSLGGARIPAGCDRIRMTLSAPAARRAWHSPPVALEIVARGRLGSRTVRRATIPAEDMMQAFGLRHLVPARQLLVDVTGLWRKLPPLRLRTDRPVRIPLGGSAEVDVIASGLPALANVEFKLADPPKGITLGAVRATRDGVALTLLAERGQAIAGTADNLIVEARIRLPVRPPKKKSKKAKAAPKTRVEVIVLPAVPCVVIDK